MKYTGIAPFKAWTLLFVLLISVCLFPSDTVKAYTVVQGQKIYDDAGLLSDYEISQLSAQIVSVEKAQGIDIYILTTNDDQGYTSDTYSDYFFDEGHVDKNIFKEDTVILLINMDYREVYLSCYGRCKDKFNSSRIHTITDAVASHLSDMEYFKACEVAIDNIDHYMETDLFYFQVWFQLLVACGISAVIVIIMAVSRGSHVTTTANTYLDQGHSRLRFHHDNYIRTVVTKTRKPQNNNSGGGGRSGGGPSGHSHSGGGSRF